MTSLLGLLSLKDSSLIYSYSSEGLLLFFSVLFYLLFEFPNSPRLLFFFTIQKQTKKQKTKRNDTRKKIESKNNFF